MGSRPVRIAVVSDAVLPWHRGGKEFRYGELLKRWDRPDVEVSVYTMKWWEGDAPTEGHLRYHALCAHHEMYHGKRRSIRQAIHFAFATFKLLFVDCDVIEADHMPYIPLFPLRIVASIKRVPLVVTWHELWGREYWTEYLGVAGNIGAFVEWLATKLPTLIAVVSSGSADRLRRMGVPDKRIVIVPNAISGAYIDSVPASSDAVDILFVGRLIGHKRADLVIDAVSEIPDATLRIVGSGPERESLEQRAIDKECASRVIFAGDVAEHEDVIALMKAARVVALPSEREGFGIAVAEALACGTPVVTSNHPDNEARHLVDDGVDGSVIEAGSVVELRKALSRWRQPDHARSSLRSSFWAHHGDLEWDQVAENYLNALISLGKR